MITPVYQGSVKDLLGPVRVKGKNSLIFQYSDAYSIFDWGRMPDHLSEKGACLAIMAASLYEKLQEPSRWVEFSSSKTALELRKGIGQIPNEVKQKASDKRGLPTSLSACFNEIAEKLQKEGLRTHLLGALHSDEIERKTVTETLDAFRLKHFQALDPNERVFRHLAVEKVNVIAPNEESIMGRSVLDYSIVRETPLPRLVPLEVIFRFSLPSGSSMIKKLKDDPGYLKTLPFPAQMAEQEIKPGVEFSFPIVELSTKLETEDRRISLAEALNASGLKAEQLEQVLLQTVWVAGFLKNEFSKLNLNLADGKLEWGISENGDLFLVDAVGPDELRILKGGIQLSKEVLRHHYRKTTWYSGIERAKKTAKEKGVSDWKRFVTEQPQSLSKEKKEIVSQLYMALTNSITEFDWFPNAWSLDHVCEEVQELVKD